MKKITQHTKYNKKEVQKKILPPIKKPDVNEFIKIIPQLIEESNNFRDAITKAHEIDNSLLEELKHE